MIEVKGTCSIVIPTYLRGPVILDSVRALLALVRPADEIIVVDQTPKHSPDVETSLARLNADGSIRWIRLSHPSIPHAMNVGLQAATSDRVLFLDDDIVPDVRLVELHRSVAADVGLVAGMVLQPGQRPKALGERDRFQFNSDSPADIEEFMGGNFSIRRDIALALDGFDENFIGAAYRFEAEFAHRYVQKHGLIKYEPQAVIHHLAISSGGTRAHGHHLRTVKPSHSVGAYYYWLRTRRPGWWRQLMMRPLRSVRTRHHLRRPWWIPVTLLAELRGLWLALRLLGKGPALINSDSLGTTPPGSKDAK